MTTSRRAAPGPPRRRLVGSGLARPRGGAARRAGPTGGLSGRSAVPSAAQQQKERDGRPAASGSATGQAGRLRAPRPPSGSRSYLSSPCAPVPAGPRRATRPPPSPPVSAAGRAHVSAGGAGARGRSLLPARGPRTGRGPRLPPLPLAAAGPRPGGAGGGGRAARWAAGGCLVSASSRERGLFSWPRQDLLLFLLLLLLTPLHSSSSCPRPLDWRRGLRAPGGATAAPRSARSAAPRSSPPPPALDAPGRPAARGALLSSAATSA